MNRHEGVSCDSCLKGNFRGRRYKCLLCYDYDLCSVCFEAAATNTRHSADHPMQCILTRADFELYYGGEALANVEQPQAYTCPYCSRMGFTDTTLQEHVVTDHVDTTFEVVCPVCAAMPGGDPNLMTDDFAGHLTLEHRTGPRDLISFLDEPVATRVHSVRRIPHTSHLGSGRSATRSGRAQRSNMHFSTGALSSLSPSSRESVDPIAELLSQLSGVRRTTGSSSSNTPSQLQQLQMQLQLERQQVNISRHQMERIPRRQAHSSQTASRDTISNTDSNTAHTVMLKPSVSIAQSSSTVSSPTLPSNFLLAGVLEEMSHHNITDEERSERSRFVQQLVLSTIVKKSDNDESSSKEAVKSLSDCFV